MLQYTLDAWRANPVVACGIVHPLPFMGRVCFGNLQYSPFGYDSFLSYFIKTVGLKLTAGFQCWTLYNS